MKTAVNYFLLMAVDVVEEISDSWHFVGGLLSTDLIMLGFCALLFVVIFILASKHSK